MRREEEKEITQRDYYTDETRSGKTAWWFNLSWMHGVLSTISSITTLATGIDFKYTVALSGIYFILDNIKGVSGMIEFSVADWIHHAAGVLMTGAVLYTRNPVAAEAIVWCQTNEISTVFLWPYLEGGRDRNRAVLFSIVFFLSRIVLNTVYVMPKFFKLFFQRGEALPWVPFMALYQILQYFWFYKIVKMAVRKPKESSPEGDKLSKKNE
eukprot:gb/GEZN01010347.1/.p1 GENE.gb/GEZN01010347.1/~~gb/GEZN01010347.1/.p1  ORF type:complete len:211 (-),score=24.30 gb/GEZN01010347.1/:518-1150(-)